ncbi:MAG: acyltransferase [Solirubrobacteraceae bacterium]|nr:acyltransferase [Solirubrobacteraceae bacterium]
MPMPEADVTLVRANNRKEWFLGSVVNRIPFSRPRARLYERLGKIQFEAVDDTLILRGVEVLNPHNIQIGRGSVINRKVLLDGRGGLEIGRDVGIAERSVVLTGAHAFEGGITDHVWRTRVEDNVFVNIGAMIMPGVIVGRGAIIAAGAIVTKDVEPWTVVAGVPAKKIGERTPCEYELFRRGGAAAYDADWR